MKEFLLTQPQLNSNINKCIPVAFDKEIDLRTYVNSVTQSPV